MPNIEGPLSDYSQLPQTEVAESAEPSLNYVSPSVFGTVGSVATRVSERSDRSTSPVRNAYGYLMVATGSSMVGLEQSPWNENFRISEGMKTLVRTQDPSAVESRVRIVTLPIEAVPAAIIALVVHSCNPVIQRSREAFYSWMIAGENRIEYRLEIKDERKRTKANWKDAVERDKQDRNDEENRPNLYWKSLISRDKECSKDQKERLKNENRIRSGKKPKKTSLEKREIKDERKRTKANWKDAVERDKQDRKDTREVSGIGQKTLGLIKQEVTDVFLALGLGAGIVIFKEAMINPNVSVKRTIWTGVKSVLTISFASGKIGYYVAAGTKSAKWDIPHTNHTLHYEQQAQWLIDYGTDTKALMTVLLAIYGPGWVKKLWHRMPKREAKFQKWLAQQAENQPQVNLGPIRT